MKTVKSLILSFSLLVGSCLAMEQVIAPPVAATARETDISSSAAHSQAMDQEKAFSLSRPELLEQVAFAEGDVKQMLPSELISLILQYTLTTEHISKVFNRIGQLRGISREWDVLLHDPVLLKEVFHRCKYPESILRNTAAIRCLSEYVGSVVSKQLPTAHELDLLDLVRAPIWTFSEVLECLGVGPHCTTASLRANPELLQAVVALGARDIAVSSGSSEGKMMPLIVEKLVSLFSENIKIYAKKSLAAVVQESLDTLPHEARLGAQKKIRDIFGRLLCEASDELSYGSLITVLSTINDPEKILALTARELLDLIRAQCKLSEIQVHRFTKICEGKTDDFLRSVDTKRLSAIELDVALMLASKAEDTRAVRALFKVQASVEVEEATALEFRIFSGCQIFKRHPTLSEEFFEEFFRAFLKFFNDKRVPLEYQAIPIIHKLHLICQVIVQKEEVRLFCAIADKLFQSMGGADPLPCEWLEACLEQDEEKVRKGLESLKLETPSAMWVYVEFGFNVAHCRQLTRTMKIFKTTERGANFFKEVERLRSKGSQKYDILHSSIIMLLREMARLDNCLKPYWVDSFIQSFTYTQEEQGILDAVRTGDDTGFNDALAKCDLAKKPYFLELALLVALRWGNISVATSLMKTVSLYRDNTTAQIQLFRWVSLLAADRGFEELWESLSGHIKSQEEYIKGQSVEEAEKCGLRRLLRAMLLTSTLSRDGFMLAARKYDDLLKKEQEDGVRISKDWLLACWNEDEELFTQSRHDIIEPVFLTWACVTGRIKLLKFLLQDPALKSEMENHRQYYLYHAQQGKSLALIAYLKRFLGIHEVQELGHGDKNG